MNKDMKLSDGGLRFVKGFESFVGYVYDDKRAPVKGKYVEWNGGPVKGTLTIGYGHTNSAKHPLKISKGLRITEAQAREILDVDLDECEEAVNRLVKVPITQGQFDALVSFAFNCGTGNLKKLIVPLNRGDHAATRAKLDLYIKSKGEVMRGLQRRRDGEQALWDSHDAPAPTVIIEHPAEVDREPGIIGKVASDAGLFGQAWNFILAAVAGATTFLADTQQAGIPLPATMALSMMGLVALSVFIKQVRGA